VGNDHALFVTNGSNLTFDKEIGRKRVDVLNVNKNFTVEIVVTGTDVIKRIQPIVI